MSTARRAKRLIGAAALLLAVCGFAAGLPDAGASAAARPPAAARPADVDDFSFSSFSADYTLPRDDDGHSRLRTVETLVAEFPAFDQNRGIVRHIPAFLGSVDLGTEVIRVTENGSPVHFEVTTADGFTTVSVGTDAFVHGTTSYGIEYTQRDVVRSFADTGAEEFYWDVNGTGWSQSFGRVAATVHVAAGPARALTGAAACYVGAEGSADRCVIDRVATAAGTEFTAAADAVGPFRNITVAIAFQPGTFTPGEPADRSFIVSVVPWIVMGLVPGIAVLIIVLRLAVWRDAPGRGTIVVQYTAPPGLPPLTAAALLGRRAEGVPAQLLDFAVLRAARLIEFPDAGRAERYGLELRDPEAIPEGRERAILRALFPGMTPGVVLRLDTRSRSLGDRMTALVRAADTELDTGRYRAKIRTPIPPILVVLLLGAVLVAFLTLSWAADHNADGALAGWSLVVAVLGVFFVLPRVGAPRRLTAKGTEAKEYLLGMREYLRLAEADRLRVLQSPDGAERVAAGGVGDPADPAVVVKLFERMLPWAVLWGLEREWTEELERHYRTAEEMPDWYSGSGSFPSSDSLRGFSSTVSASSFATTPVASSGASSSAGGSSGGGSSGGGGGGGGGGGR